MLNIQKQVITFFSEANKTISKNYCVFTIKSLEPNPPTKTIGAIAFIVLEEAIFLTITMYVVLLCIIQEQRKRFLENERDSTVNLFKKADFKKIF